MHCPIRVFAAGIFAAAFFCGPAAAAQSGEKPSSVKRVSLSSLTAQGFEVKAVTAREALIVQKGPDVYWCTLHLANTSPMSYRSECYSIR
jgi:hypothetical protein